MAKDHKKPKTKAPKTNRKTAPNFTLVGEASPTIPALIDLLRFSEVIRHGKNTWQVRARFDEWVGRAEAHTVWMLHGMLYCDCRQHRAGRTCAHEIAVRHLGMMIAKAEDPQQLRLLQQPETPVRFMEPERKRIAALRFAPNSLGAGSARGIKSAYSRALAVGGAQHA